MKKISTLQIILLVFGLLVVVSLFYWNQNQNKPSDLDTFAQCLGTKGVRFYGAFWCPHCQAQKALFGNSKTKLPYVECSTPDQQGQTQICKDKGITGYPTWSFQIATGTATVTSEVFSSGEKTLQELSNQTGCQLPQSAMAASTTKPAI